MRTDAARGALLVLLALCGCDAGLPIARIELGLVPEDVTSIAIWVTDTEGREVVASATVSPPITSVELGVPAERPLEFSVLARTDQPGPAELGGRMPGWVGRVLKRIPLGSEQVVLPITAHPAGALRLVPKLAEELDGPVRIRLAAETGDSPLELDLAAGSERVLALRSGRYRVTIAEEDEEEAMVLAGDGIFVERRVESIGIVELAPRVPVPPPEAVRSIQVRLTDPGGTMLSPPITTSTAGALVRVVVRSFDADGITTGGEAEVVIDLAAAPASVIRTRRITASGLPAISEPIEIRGRGRLSILARAILRDDDRPRVLDDDLRVNVLGPDDRPGPATRLELDLLGDEDDLIRGTRFSAELIDDRGLFASESSGAMSFAASDPWLFFPGGPSAEVTPDDRGHLIREVARPSGPRGLFVVLRAAYTSTSVPGTLTASVTLPVLESSE